MRPTLIIFNQTLPEISSGEQSVVYFSIEKFSYLQSVWDPMSVLDEVIAFKIEPYKA